MGRLIAAIGAVLLVVIAAGFLLFFGPSGGKANPEATATATATNTAVVEGHVWEANYPHGPAIADAWVSLIGRFDGNQYKRDTAKTDSQGYFKFSGVPYGTYDLAVNAASYAVTMTAESFEVQEPQVEHDLLPWKVGTLHPLGPVGDTINFVRAGGVHNRNDAVIVILGFSFIKSEDEIASVDCDIVVTHNDVRIAYRAGGSLEFYSGGLIDEAACKVVLKNGDVWYVQRVCGNLLKVPPGAPPITEKPAPPTATPTQPREEVPPTATPTPPMVSSPSPPVTNTPPTCNNCTPVPPTATPTSCNCLPPTATPPATQIAQPTPPTCCTVVPADRPTVVPTAVNTIAVPPEPTQPVQTRVPDPVGGTPATH